MRKKRISKKEAEQIRLAIADLATAHSIKDIYFIGMFQLTGSYLFLKLTHSRHKYLGSINHRLLKILIKLYNSYYEQQ